MTNLKELTVYTNGDPNKLSTFSNVPYFFIHTLRARGIKVNTVDIQPIARWGKIWNRYILRILMLFLPKTNYSYDRTWINQWTTQKKIKKGVEIYPNSEAHIFLTFIGTAKPYSSKPTILISDWDYEYVLRYFESRVPDFFQIRAILRQRKIMNSSDHIFFLFPGSKKAMEINYPIPQKHVLRNFLNAFEWPTSTEIIYIKKKEWNLLFIGKNHYIKGAKAVLEAFQHLKISYPKIQLHIVGLKPKEIGPIPSGVQIYGYLDKEIKEQRQLFYELLRKASVFINTTPKWGAYSSTLEAMNFYTPIIVSPYDEFVGFFGKEIGFGAYAFENNPKYLESKILEILRNPHYEKMALDAHERVKNFTWENVINAFLLDSGL